ncbi:hypothetical protein NSQ59_27225 [Margalitia sp. FSL K6-0131]|uniref:hypothetical protein n=1 Tax=Margalitia sp. FSL K6-0131 TaxID=2954604 RepID=UPI0030FAE1F6
MKSYSKLNIIKRKLNEGKKSLLDYFLEPKYGYLDIEVPHYDYLRGNVLLSDIKVIAKDFPAIQINELIDLLYVQFLYQVRKGKKIQGDGMDLNELGLVLLSKINFLNLEGVQAYRKVKKLTAVSQNLFMLQEQNEVEETNEKKEKVAIITIRMKLSEIYRGEILLNDLYNVNNEINLSVEQLISLLYIDFIRQVEKNGNSEKVIQSIIDSFESYSNYL